MVYHIPVLLMAGVVVGVGMAVYANREDIKAFIDKKRLEKRLREGPKRDRKQPPMLSKHFDNGDDDIYDKNNEIDPGMDMKDSDLFSLHEMPSKQHDFDQESMASSFELEKSTSYYTSGATSSAERFNSGNVPMAAPPFSPSYMVRQRGNHYYLEATQFELQPTTSRTDSFSASEVSTEPSLIYSRRSSESDSSWIRAGSSLESVSELSTPFATSSEVSTDDDYQSIMHISEDDSSTYQLRRLPHANA